jgi:hypothetical protein
MQCCQLNITPHPPGTLILRRLAGARCPPFKLACSSESVGLQFASQSIRPASVRPSGRPRPATSLPVRPPLEGTPGSVSQAFSPAGD